MTFIWQPIRVAISAITKALPCVITTAVSHGLATGGVVRVHVPKTYGMSELNQLQASITVLSPTTFSLQYVQIPNSIDVDSRAFTTFVIPSRPGATAEILSIGSGPTLEVDSPVLIRNRAALTTLDDQLANLSTTNTPYGGTP